jgi:hypothetical protein
MNISTSRKMAEYHDAVGHTSAIDFATAAKMPDHLGVFAARLSDH